MKLIDLIELLFRPMPVQFEPMPWLGPMPKRWLHADWPDVIWAPARPHRVAPTRVALHRFQYSDRFVETVSAARVVRS